MQAVVDVTVMAAAVVWSAVIIIALLKCNLHRTPLCSVAGLGVTAMVWRAFPPVQELPLVVSFIFWLGMSLCVYYWPTQLLPDPPREHERQAEDDVLDRFFQGE